MANRVGYLVVNIKKPEDRAVYTYKKGVMEHTGIGKNDMLSFSGEGLYRGYLIVWVDIKGFTREKGVKRSY